MVSEKIETDIARFFSGRDKSLELFNRVRRLIESKRSPGIKVSKTQIAFGEKYQYVWVWLPQTWIKKRNEDSITLTIATGKKVRSRRIEESVQPRKGYWTHHIIIEKIEDVDVDVEHLIQESIDFYLERLAKKRQGSKKEKSSDS